MVPGLGGSGKQHWQTRWLQVFEGSTTVRQSEWHDPDPQKWVEQLAGNIRDARSAPILVAHSLGCAVVAECATSHVAGSSIRAALLVAPADVEDPDRVPEQAQRFAPLNLDPLMFPALVVASDDDPFCRFARAKFFADQWSAEFAGLKGHGHINASGLGDWADGQRLLRRVMDMAAGNL